MAKILTSNKNYYDIANTIRQMKEVNTTYKPREMASALKDIYSNEVEGVPPLSFEANGNNLLNYRIDGAIGGVGDKTKNLFDGQFESGSGISSGNNRCRAKNPIQVEAGKKYTLSHTITNDFDFVINSSTNKTYPFDSNTITICGNSITWKSDNITFSCTNNGYISIVVRKQDNSNIYPDEIDTSLQIMFEESSTATDYEPYGYKVPVVVSGNNLAKWDTHLQPQTNGIVLNDTNSISSIINVSNINNIYIFGDRTKLNSNVYRIGKSNEPISLNSQTTRITFTGGILDTSDCNYVIVSCSIYNTETTFDEIKNSFMIVEGTTSPDNFEPYIEPTTTNIYLDEPILENESISLSDTNTNIPTIDGTNVLTINTTVQPSNVYIQAPKDSLEAIQIANRLEEI